ncbi:lysosomal-associated transmembrane protein 4A isoform X2 [Leguminivora glycinivorella]|uniref:lysosomal-associated transmembrane protein 4A isoform X2 n=1 Tax=Leguminivora glycinivorella TaxID=1035111 RepID=UPI00200BB26F|nr:lysosomal-associated transmembrane protein 4A isoform X2 [Leguminivora glycinivorella]
MLRFRPKLGSERNSEWRCCFCLHVRTGTILLGTWHLMLHLVALGFLAAVVRDPRLLDELESDSNPMPTPLSNVDNRPGTYMQRDHNHSLIYLCTLAITLMLIYGASRGKPAHLLPFFCLQIFDFAITVLTATGYLYYLRSIHRLVAETKRVPWREQLLALPAPALALVVLSVFLLAVLLKGYCISMVWRCYKYLTMRAHALHSLTPFVISGETLAAPPYTAPPPQPDYSSLLPDYEEAVKQTPPPSYRAATLMAHADPAVTTPPTPPGAVAGAVPGAASVAPPADTVVMLPQQGAQARV